MKKVDTEVLSGVRISFQEIQKLLEELPFDENIWLCLYDTKKSNPNYVQTHSDISGDEEVIKKFQGVPYLIEARIYHDNENFTHYRTFTDDKAYLESVFEAYYNDRPFSYETWQDVTNEFLEENNTEKEPFAENITNFSEEEKAENFFWEAIEKSYKYNKNDWQSYDIEKHLERLTNYLAKHSKEELVQFEITLQKKLIALYTAEIAELNIILEGDFSQENGVYTFDEYLSTDGFIYFRCWLLLKGRAFFNDITRNIQYFTSGKYSFNIGDIWAEGLLYVADNAYLKKNKTAGEFEIRDVVYEKYPQLNYDSGDFSMNRPIHNGNELQNIYPILVQKIMEIR